MLDSLIGGPDRIESNSIRSDLSNLKIKDRVIRSHID